MKSIGLVAPASRRDAILHAKRACDYLNRRGVAVSAEPDAAALLEGCSVLEDGVQVDALVTLGGDGTLLRGAQYAAVRDVPLLGINLGQTGFLAETEPEQLENALEGILTERFSEELRPMLDIRIPGAGSWLAMNDAVLTRGGYARLITVRAVVDGEEAGCYRADGLVVATPTGSTGYSLSAGGPIISPKVDCMVITPVCAHSLQHRPGVVDGHAHILLELGCDEEMTASLQVDGQNRGLLTSGQTVEISKSDRFVRLIRLHDAKFFQVVRTKLAEWST